MPSAYVTNDMGIGDRRAFVTLAASGAVIAATAAKRIRVFAVVASALAACNIKFQSAAVDVTAAFPAAANGGFVMPQAQTPWFQTNAGEALNLVMSISTSVAVQVIYDLVD